MGAQKEKEWECGTMWGNVGQCEGMWNNVWECGKDHSVELEIPIGILTNFPDVQKSLGTD